MNLYIPRVLETSQRDMHDNLFQKELHYVETCFTEINGYPKWLLKQTFDSFITTNKNNNDNIKH